MSDYHEPSCTPNPDPSKAPSTTVQHADPDDETLMKMQRDFPDHTIWREIIPGRTVYVARARHPAVRPYTVITPDLPELLAALTEASHAGGTP